MKTKALQSRKGESYVDTGVKILAAVVCGALVLGAVFFILKDTVLKNVKTEISGMFNAPYSDPLVWEKGVTIVPASGDTWNMEGNTLTGYKGTITANMNLVIPNEVDGVRVLKIQNPDAVETVAATRLNIFGNIGVTTPFTVTIPNGIKEIGSCAFYGCSGITGRLLIPQSVTTIGGYAFAKCTGIEGDLVLEDSITSVGTYAFYQCSKLTGLMLSSNLKVIKPVTFGNCGFTKLDIPGTVKTLELAAFTNLSNLTSLTLHDGLETIGPNAFQLATAMRGNLVIPDTVKVIEEKAFILSTQGGFDGTLTLSKNLISVGLGAFQNQNFTGALVLPDSMTSVGDSAFISNRNLTSITLSKNLLTIGKASFSLCASVAGPLVLPESLTAVGDRAFNRCYLLSGDLRIPDSVTSLGAGSLDETAFTSMSVPKHITEAVAKACFVVTTPPPITIRT